MINDDGNEVLSIKFKVFYDTYIPEVRMETFSDGDIINRTILQPNMVTCDDLDNNFTAQYSARILNISDFNYVNKYFRVNVNNGQSYLSITMNGLPTSSASINVGDLYRDSNGFVKVKI
jgi:hypothetical protein